MPSNTGYLTQYNHIKQKHPLGFQESVNYLFLIHLDFFNNKNETHMICVKIIIVVIIY